MEQHPNLPDSSCVRIRGPVSAVSADRPAGSTVLVNRALIVILATVVLDAVGIGLALPVIPSLLRELSHETRIAGRFGYFMAIYPFMQFLFSPVLGRLSDRFGRRPVLLVSLGVAAVDYLIMGLSPLLAVLYLGRVLAGMTGANLAVATAYIADISGPDERARRFGYMNACFGLGFVAGPLLGGLVGSCLRPLSVPARRPVQRPEPPDGDLRPPVGGGAVSSPRYCEQM